MKRHVIAALTLAALTASQASAASLALSIAIRETGGAGPAFANGGTANGIEWVNRDGQSLQADGTWQLFTFTPATDTLLAFAGATANSILEPGLQWAVLEHVRILNSDGITQPIRLWIDDITNTTSQGSAVEGFETAALGTGVIFQSPNFSGSTAGNLVAGGTAVVSNSMAFSGSQSNELNFQFVDNDPTRWARVTTFGSGGVQLPNPLVEVRDASGGPTTITFYAKAQVIPEPASAAMVGLALMGLVAVRRRK